MENPPLPARFGIQLGLVGQLYAQLVARLLEPHDLTYAQFMLLLHLTRRSGPARISDMTRAVDLTQPAVTKIVQKFQGLGWVTAQADGSDQRARPVVITDAGRAAAQAVQRAFGPAFAGLLEGWQPDEITRLTADLDRLSQRLAQMKTDAVRTGD